MIYDHVHNILRLFIGSANFHIQRFLNKPKLLMLEQYTTAKEEKLKTTNPSHFYHLSQKSMKSLFKTL